MRGETDLKTSYIFFFHLQATQKPILANLSIKTSVGKILNWLMQSKIEQKSKIEEMQE